MEQNEKKMSIVNAAQLKVLRISKICGDLSQSKLDRDVEGCHLLLECLYTELVGLLGDEEIKQVEQFFQQLNIQCGQHYQAPDNKTKHAIYLNSLRKLELWLRRKLTEHGLETATVNQQGDMQ